MAPGSPIIVAGAGIGGLSAALALALRGFSVRIVERAAEINEVGAGVQMGPNGFRALERLGLVDEMREVAFSPSNVVMRDSASGEALVSQPFGTAFEARFGHPYSVAYRADLQNMLLRAVRRHPGLIELRLGDGLVGFTQSNDAVEVRLASGAAWSGAALVGADGLWSKVRHVLMGDGAPRFSGHVAYRAMIPASEVAAEILTDDVQVWVGPRHHLVCYKLRRGELFNIVAIFHSDRDVEGWDREGSPDELRAGFAGACAPLLALIGQIRLPRMWALHDRDPARGWSQGRVTLLGDAAHPMLPYLAQGASMAIEDAVCLADTIVAGDGDMAGALLAYEEARFARTASVQLTARESGGLYHADGKMREARDAAFRGKAADDYEANAWLFDGEGSRGSDGGRAGLFASR